MIKKILLYIFLLVAICLAQVQTEMSDSVSVSEAVDTTLNESLPEESLPENNETISDETLTETNETMSEETVSEETLPETNETMSEDTQESTNECPDGLCPSTPTEENSTCTQDVQQCEDGSFVGRDPDNNCEYFPCKNETNATECIYGTLRFGGYCACWSGASGKNCTMGNAAPGTETGKFPSVINNPWSRDVRDIEDVYYKLDFDLMAGKSFLRNFTGHSCAAGSWEKVYDLETGGVPVIDSLSFGNTTINIVVSHPLVDGRADGTLFLNNDDIDVLHEDCYYPRSDYIEKEVQGCRDVWIFDIPWVTAKTCGWKIDNEETHIVYRGQVVMHSMEWLSINQWRKIRSVLRLKIRFQKFIRVDCETTILNEKILSAAITRQIVAINLDEPALVELTTILNFPYKLFDGELVKYPTEKIERFNFSYKDCDASESAECVQSWRTTLYLTEGTCRLDGDYAINFTLGCRENFDKCDEEATTIEYKLRSEDFCAEMMVDVGLYGKLLCFADADLKVLKEKHIVGQKAYFLISVNSDINPRNSLGQLDTEFYNEVNATIKFESVDLFKVSIRMVSEIVQLWESGAPSSDDLDTQIALLDSFQGQKNQIAFSFIFSRKLLVALNKNNGKNLKATIGAEVEVHYSDDTSEIKPASTNPATATDVQSTASDSQASTLTEVGASSSPTVYNNVSAKSDKSTLDNTQDVEDPENPDNSAASLFACFFVFIAALLI